MPDVRVCVGGGCLALVLGPQNDLVLHLGIALLAVPCGIAVDRFSRKYMIALMTTGWVPTVVAVDIVDETVLPVAVTGPGMKVTG